MEVIRDIVESDYRAIVDLNRAEEKQTSAMDLARLDELVNLSDFRKVLAINGQVAAFILAMREHAHYQNDNFAWFSARIPRFLYVDRIVVGSGFSGRRIGTRLYRELFSFARSEKVGTVACEYNIDPPNPASRAFHDRHGFRELGTQLVAGGTKLVSLQAADT